ncbi:MAG: bifunctional helix-turn-helix domain-containing protein/methylated-DNA--[protein]-cysteine S-methyltransferase [Hyphomicrobiales bacterium]|nr:bifunctional helix-turn-helix domain-containing protein/methylated-DNA--[protein]-cysteine S-methyltransferase [Hyphomicrobiales bacterium]
MLTRVTEQPCDDYARVQEALAFMTGKWRSHPGIDAIAAHVGLTPKQFHDVFRRWAGLSPKDFLAALTLAQARKLLRDGANLFETSLELGLSGPSRLHDLFVTHEALSPHEYRKGAAGLVLSYGFHPSPFGEALVVTTPRGMAGLGFVDGARADALADMQARWPGAHLVEDQELTAPYAARAFQPELWQPETPLRVVLIGTDFEVSVWETLLTIPMGQATTYGRIASKIARPKAARAVGAAVGRNPISFVVPCHRVLGQTGALTGYHWGLTRKQAMLGWEAGQCR